MTIATALGVAADQIAPGMPGKLERQPRQQRVVQALDVIGGEGPDNLPACLADLVDYYSHAVGMTSPTVIYDELLDVRLRARDIIARGSREPRRADLLVSAGWLSNLLAVAACDMGEHATARLWCADSMRRSEETGYTELAAWALLTQAMIAYYQGQSRQSASLAARGRTYVSIGTAAYAKLAAQEMRAAAQVGDAADMSRARSEATAAMQRLRPDASKAGIFSIAPGDEPPYTATSLLLVGDYKGAVPATNRVISTVYQAESRRTGENPSGYARSLLILGLAHAGTRCLDDAVAAGHAALTCKRPAWPTMVLAGRLDRVLAHDYADSKQTAAYHRCYLEALSQHKSRPVQAGNKQQ